MLPFEIHNKEIAKLLMKTPRDDEAISNFDEFIIHGEKSIFYIFAYRSFTQLTLRIKGNVIRTEQELQDIMGITNCDSEFIFLVLSDSKYCEITLESYMDSLRYLDRATIEKLFYYFFDFHNDTLKNILKDTRPVTWKDTEQDTEQDTGKNVQLYGQTGAWGVTNYVFSGIIYPFKRFVSGSLDKITWNLSGDSEWNKVEKEDDETDDETDDEIDDILNREYYLKKWVTVGTIGTIGSIGSLFIFSSILIKMIIRSRINN